MKNPRLNELIAVLPSMSKHELAVLRGAIERLLGHQASPASPLYAALTAVAGVKLPYQRFQASASYKAWPQNEKLVLTFIRDTWDPTKVTEAALSQYLMGLLADDLKGRGLPVSVGTLAVNISSIPQVFEQAFPGYRAAGLAQWVLANMVRKY